MATSTIKAQTSGYLTKTYATNSYVTESNEYTKAYIEGNSLMVNFTFQISSGHPPTGGWRKIGSFDLPRNIDTAGVHIPAITSGKYPIMARVTETGDIEIFADATPADGYYRGCAVYRFQ